MPISKKIRVLGLDPGLGTTGYGVIGVQGNQLSCLGFGVIKTSPGQSGSQRLLTIQQEIIKLLQLWQPGLVGIERLAVGRNTPTVVMVSQARGVLVAACAATGVPIIEISANQVKLGVTGFGYASKGQVARLLCAQLHITKPITPDDAADALAVAVACSSRHPS
jgi:crossover junction endodeoxyribonuclease RuvC